MQSWPRPLADALSEPARTSALTPSSPFGDNKHMKAKVIALWICALYFAVLFYKNINFGTLGVIRPGDTTNGMIEVNKASALIRSFADQQQSLTGLVGLGAVLLSCLAVWFTSGLVKRGNKANQHGRVKSVS